MLASLLAHFVWWRVGGLFAMLALTSAALRRYVPEKHKRIRTPALLFLSYLLGLLVGVLLEAARLGKSANTAFWFAEVFESFVAINLGALVTFEIALRAMKLRLSSFYADLVSVVAYVGVLVREMHLAGINLTGLLATSAVISGVVGLALAPTLGNIFGGVALQLDSSISEGDWIQLDANTQGRVVAIRWRHTVVETRNWDTVIVPNVTLLSSNILVLGKRTDKPRQRRYWVYFNVDFRYPPAEVIRVVTEALHAAPMEHVAQDPKPSVVCMDFANNGRDSMAYYGARYWLTDLAVDDPTNSKIRERIHAALARAGIPLAMPATTVFLSQDDEAHAESKRRREHRQRMELLQSLPLFRELTEAERESLAEAMTRAPFAKGESMTIQGREAHWLYLLASGTGDVILADDDGTQRKVGTLVGPDFFGERGVMTGEPRSATVVAATPCLCYRLDKEAFKAILTQRPEVANIVAAALLQRRGELLAAQDGMDAEQARRERLSQHNLLLSQIQGFFGLG